MRKLLYFISNMHGSYKMLHDITLVYKIMIYEQSNKILSLHEH
jgi:hypothetical protein